MAMDLNKVMLVLQSRLGVALYTEGDVLDDILEGYLTSHIGNDDGIVGIPFGDKVAFVHLFASCLVKFGTVGQQGGEERDVGLGVDNTHFS